MLLNFLYIYLIISYLTGITNAYDTVGYHYKDVNPIEYISNTRKIIVFIIAFLISPISLLLILNKLVVLIINTPMIWSKDRKD